MRKDVGGQDTTVTDPSPTQDQGEACSQASCWWQTSHGHSCTLAKHHLLCCLAQVSRYWQRCLPDDHDHSWGQHLVLHPHHSSSPRLLPNDVPHWVQQLPALLQETTPHALASATMTPSSNPTCRPSVSRPQKTPGKKPLKLSWELFSPDEDRSTCYLHLEVARPPFQSIYHRREEPPTQLPSELFTSILVTDMTYPIPHLSISTQTKSNSSEYEEDFQLCLLTPRPQRRSELSLWCGSSDSTLI